MKQWCHEGSEESLETDVLIASAGSWKNWKDTHTHTHTHTQTHKHMTLFSHEKEEEILSLQQFKWSRETFLAEISNLLLL
jgi:hypothetical protein